MRTDPAAYAASIAEQARRAPDGMLVHLLIYASRATIVGSPAEAISAAETEAVAAEYRRRGLAFPFWFHPANEEA
jgi:hypothetical protein